MKEDNKVANQDKSKMYVLKIIKGLNTRLHNTSKNINHFKRSELIKICWVLGYKNQASYCWKDIMNMPFLGMYATRPYRTVLLKIIELKKLRKNALKELLDEASKYDPRLISVEERLEEVEMSHPEIHNDELFEKSYRFLYELQKSKYWHFNPDLIRKRLNEYFGI